MNLRNMEAALANLEIIEEGEKADTVAMVSGGKMMFIRRYIKDVYALSRLGRLGSTDDEIQRRAAMFFLPFMIHETVEYEIDHSMIDWKDLLKKWLRQRDPMISGKDCEIFFAKDWPLI